jgi:tetratricopeptide (TPR) repeat protein
MTLNNNIIFDNNISFSLIDTAIEWLLIILLAFMPLAFGVVHAWSEEIVILLSGSIVLCFLIKFLIYKNQHIIWTWAYIPLSAFLILIVVQLIPLTSGFISIISPNTSELKKELLNDLPDADTFLKSLTLTFYPYATKHDLRLILALGGVFFVVLNEFHRPEKIKRLLGAIVVIGAFVSVITLAQNIFGNGKIYWFVNNHSSNSYSGPFVNHSHYGQFMNLSIGAALGLLMVKLNEIFTNKKLTLPAVFNYFCSSSSTSIWFLISIIGISMATVFITLTRGGIISMLIAMFFITLIISSKRHLRSHGWILVGTALISFLCILYIGFDSVYSRMATIRNLNEAGESRLQMLKDTTIAWSKFPLFGSGLGTYSVVYPIFDDSYISAHATHAENEYAQTAEETGLIGLGLLIIFAAIIGICFVKNIKRTSYSIQSASYGLGFGIIAILIHSFSDFGQHLPANAFLSAIFCALLITMSKYGRNNKSLVKTITCKNSFLNLVIFLIVCGIFTWSLFGANNSRLAEEYRKEASVIENTLIKTNWKADDYVYNDLIKNTLAAVKHEPDNIENLYLLDVYRWRSINQSENPVFQTTLLSAKSISTASEIDNHLNFARKYCPTFGPIYILSGQIEKFILNNDSGLEKIKKGYILAPCDPIACLMAGFLDISEGKYDDCFIKLNRAVELNSNFYRDVIKLYVEDLSRPYRAISLAGENTDRLLSLINIFTENQYFDLASECRIKVKNLLTERCESSEANASDNACLANIYKQLENEELAIEYYRRALTLDYSQVTWRIALARLLADTGNVPEAIDQARICLRISPNFKEAEKLLADLSLCPAGWSKEINCR